MREAQAIGGRVETERPPTSEAGPAKRFNRRKDFQPPRIYALADVDTLGTARVPGAVALMAEAGISWIQIRAKSLDDSSFYRLVESCCRQIEGTDSALWIDDRVDLAALFPVFGVHLGQYDLPPAAARAIVGEGVAIGYSTHNLDQLAAADRDPEVDVIALGPIFATESKANPDPQVGLETLRQARSSTAKPLVAIGGIDASNLSAVLEAGADCAAVLGAVCRGDIAINCQRLRVASGGDSMSNTGAE